MASIMIRTTIAFLCCFSQTVLAFTSLQRVPVPLTGPHFSNSDGNPPPFGNWGQPASPAPTPAAASPGNPPPFGDWGQPAAAVSSPAPAFTPPLASVAPAPAQAPAPASSATASGDPISILDASQSSCVNEIAASIPDLAPKPELPWDNIPFAGSSTASLDARDAPGPANCAWLASVCVPHKLSSLTIFNGPLTDVPHLLSRCCIMDDGNTMRFDLDFRPRAYGAYEMKDANGNYPGPEQLGRKAFEFSGARKEFESKFGTSEVVTFLEDAKSAFQGAIPVPPTELELLTGGPLAISLTMPVNDANVAAVKTVREKAALSWLRWAAQEKGKHDHRPGAPVNTQYVYDAKFRQNSYSALLPFYSTIFGPQDGAKLAAAESGPLDEAYVGGGS